MEKLRILLVEDDIDDREIMESAIQELCIDAQVLELTDGRALEQFVQESLSPPIDIIFMDINIPFFDGTRCLEMIRSSFRFSQVPVIMLSTSGTAADIDTAFLHGATRYMVKPYRYSTMVNLLREVFTQFRLYLQLPLTKNNFIIR